MKLSFYNLSLLLILGLTFGPANIGNLKNPTHIYSQAILNLNNNLTPDQAYELGLKVQEIHLKYELDPALILALLLTESSLEPLSESSTGDYSIAQINYKTWDKEFKRLGHEPLNKGLLKEGDISYALDKMALILSILKERHTDDPHWYGTYHSETPKLKSLYLQKVKRHYKTIEKMISISQN